MKLSKIVSLVLLGIVVVAMVYAMAMARRGFSTREEPSAIERFAAARALRLALPSNYRGLRNPVAVSPETVRTGMEHFSDHCATCHANNGNGDTLFGKGLYPKPPDMRQAETQEKSDGELYYTIENGVRLSGMPAFGEHPGTNDAETWNLVVFIRHLPTLTSDELTEMESLNPKTEGDRQEEKEEQDFLQGAEPSGKAAGETHHHH